MGDDSDGDYGGGGSGDDDDGDDGDDGNDDDDDDGADGDVLGDNLGGLRWPLSCDQNSAAGNLSTNCCFCILCTIFTLRLLFILLVYQISPLLQCILFTISRNEQNAV